VSHSEVSSVEPSLVSKGFRQGTEGWKGIIASSLWINMTERNRNIGDRSPSGCLHKSGHCADEGDAIVHSCHGGSDSSA
jgi:hypothetical protein